MEEEKYEIKKNEDGDIKPCDCCGCEVALSTYEDRGKKKVLCEVCATTFIGNSLDRRHEPVTKEILAQVANLIIEKIKG